MTKENDPEKILILSERLRFQHETGAGRLVNQCAFTSRDMSTDWPEAFTYGIVLGWDDDDEHGSDEPGQPTAMEEVAERFGWDEELIAFVRDAHARFQELATKRSEHPNA